MGRHEPPRTDYARPTLLIVDDDETVREALERLLETDFRVRAVDDVQAAVECVTTEPVCLVLLDILMSDMDGLETLARIKALRVDLPVIVMTGVDRAAPAVEAMRLGAHDCLTKPLNREILLSAVGSALRRPLLSQARGLVSPIASSISILSRTDILLVGPDITALSEVKVALSPAACKIAGSRQAALRYLDDIAPVLVVIDESLRPEDAVTVARSARSMVPGCRLAIGALDDDARARISDRAGTEVETFIHRPYDLNDVRTLVRAAVAGQPRIGVRGARMTTPVLRAIEHASHHYKTATVNSIAQAARVSPGYLGHVFPAETGMTVWDCVTAVRLEVAKDLLRETSHKLEYIAHLTGFSDAPHLSRVFSQHCGCSARCSPRGFRNRVLRKVG